jgi:5'(3')-deoxyribonucleotidase
MVNPISSIFKFALAPIPEDVIDFVYCDMDGVIADFEAKMKLHGMDGKTYKYRPGAYVHLPLMEGALEAVAHLREQFPGRVMFLTKPPVDAPYVYTEKALWMREHFGDEGLKHLIIAMDKSHIGTSRSILIDDRPHKGGVANFRGHFIHFTGWSKALLDIDILIEAL